MKYPIRNRKAVALSYHKEQDVAPKVTAKGQGHVATNIIEKATEHGVPIQEDETLIALLSEINVNETIPEELYQAVAEVFSFIYHVDKQIGAKDK